MCNTIVVVVVVVIVVVVVFVLLDLSCLTRSLGCDRYRGPWNSAWAALCHLWCNELSSCMVLVLPRWSHTACPVRRQMFHTHWRHLWCATRVRSWTDTLHHLHRWPSWRRSSRNMSFRCTSMLTIAKYMVSVVLPSVVWYHWMYQPRIWLDEL